MEKLEAELKQLIVDALFLEDVSPSEIGSDEPLFDDEGLALDSIDALEIGVELKKKYKIEIDPDDENLKTYFATVRNLAKFVAEGAHA
ncbi:phosphopantetheine-binding protein [Minwuia sp.]|uniref:phosphopantetheine-binding protein n=1 Tax=Minwuia sp. TaxID=2493630 RepID=UPI003A8CC9E5